MAFISREEFLKRQAERQERANSPRQSSGVGYLKLADDGDEAVVRFCYDNPDQFDIITVHDTKVDGKFRRVNCLRESFKADASTCPFCAAGEKAKNRFYVKLLEYTRDENDNIVAQPKIWDTSTSYVNVLNNLCTEFGDISDYVFKIKRSGRKGDTSTSYQILPTNPVTYNAELYPKNNEAFNDYNILGTAVLDKSFDELKEMVGNNASEAPVSNFVEQPSVPRRVTY